MPQPELPSAPSRARSVVVLGAGRSGTSMLAGTLAHSGWFAGGETYPGRDSNPKGFFETREINGINEYLLAGVQKPEDKLGDWQRWLMRVPVGTRFELPEDLAARVRALAGRRPFAFKDPRLCATFGAWTPHLGDFARLVVFREPQRTAHSTLEEIARQPYLAGVELGYRGALELWTSMHRHLLETHAAEGDWLFVHAAQMFTPAGLERLESFLGAPVARDFPEPALQRSPVAGELPADAAALYRELCERAGWPATSATLHPVAKLESAAPEMSVIVCSYNRRETLRECLDSFNAQSAASRMELVVVDDGSSDGTAEMLATYPFAVAHKLVSRKNGGLAVARNSGLAVARGEYVLFVNDDTIAFPDLVERHLARHAALGPGLHSVLGSFEQPREALANALMRFLEVTPYVFCYASMAPLSRHGWNRWWTCNVSVPRAAVDAAGRFDGSFRHYGCEDTDLAIRLERLGGDVVYDPSARAHHRHLLSLDDLARRQRTVARAYVRLFKKHPEALHHPDWSWVAKLDAAGLEQRLLERLPERGRLEAAARALSVLDLDHLAGPDGPADALVSNVLARLSALIGDLNPQWWNAGLLEGLREHGLASFAELVPEPWPLATQAKHRLLAWPRYDSPAELDRLVGEFGSELARRGNACLLLRHDEALDGPVDVAVQRLTEAYERNLSPTQALEVLLLTEPVPDNELARLAGAVDAVLELVAPSSDPRTRFLRDVGAYPVRVAAELEGCLR
jgi:GT2 family glycosyltransferase